MWSFTKFSISILVYGITAAVLAAAAGIYLVSDHLEKPGPLAEEKFFTIESGQGLNVIAANLKREGIISNDIIFIAGTRIKNLQSDMKAGEYQFSPQTSAAEVIHKINVGAVYLRAVSIPEGLTSYQIVQRLNAEEILEGQITDIPAEGLLLPDTYPYSRGEDVHEVLARMNKAMVATLTELWAGRAEGLPVKDANELVTLASIVEKETGVAAERERIAGVFVNRLKAGMPLQTDPTVIYALTKGQPQEDGQGPLGRRLLTKDLELDSPYNTYKYPGLPPGPICNPGRAAIEASLNPETHDFLYFVADGKGGHVFAATLEEHNANVAKWREIRAQQSKP